MWEEFETRKCLCQDPANRKNSYNIQYRFAYPIVMKLAHYI